jgi:hypothetical protein
MLTAEQNYRLLQEIDANRTFILMAYRQNPKLLERAEPRIRQLFAGLDERDPPEAPMTLAAVPPTPTIAGNECLSVPAGADIVGGACAVRRNESG